jgi:hypothetical protein
MFNVTLVGNMSPHFERAMADGTFDLHFAGEGTWLLSATVPRDGKTLKAMQPVDVGATDLDNVTQLVAPFSLPAKSLSRDPKVNLRPDCPR